MNKSSIIFCNSFFSFSIFSFNSSIIFFLSSSLKLPFPLKSISPISLFSKFTFSFSLLFSLLTSLFFFSITFSFSTPETSLSYSSFPTNPKIFLSSIIFHLLPIFINWPLKTNNSFFNPFAICCNSPAFKITFFLVEFLIVFALLAKYKVWILSSECLFNRLAVHNKVVFELPPKLSLNIKVNLLFLNGICLVPGVVKAIITIPNVVRDWFIFCASLSLWPSAPVFAILSLPAKSTKERRDFLTRPSIELYINSNCIIACERELLSF